MNNLESKNEGLNSTKGRIIAIIVLGSLCGFIEVILGGLLRKAGFPVTSGLLTGLGFGIIAFGLGSFWTADDGYLDRSSCDSY